MTQEVWSGLPSAGRAEACLLQHVLRPVAVLIPWRAQSSEGTPREGLPPVSSNRADGARPLRPENRGRRSQGLDRQSLRRAHAALWSGPESEPGFLVTPTCGPCLQRCQVDLSSEGSGARDPAQSCGSKEGWVAPPYWCRRRPRAPPPPVLVGTEVMPSASISCLYFRSPGAAPPALQPDQRLRVLV